eukprot:691492-Amphidinium_carterae.3
MAVGCAVSPTSRRTCTNWFFATKATRPGCIADAWHATTDHLVATWAPASRVRLVAVLTTLRLQNSQWLQALAYPFVCLFFWTPFADAKTATTEE